MKMQMIVVSGFSSRGITWLPDCPHADGSMEFTVPMAPGVPVGARADVHHRAKRRSE